MQTFSFSPSVNIIRDKDREINYIRTINGQLAFEQIVETANSGARAFTIIGAYGSGKSVFLWALERALKGDAKFFDHFDYFLRGYSSYEFLNIVGEFESLEKVMAKELHCKQQEVIEAFQTKANALRANGQALLVRIDEFGKFLEYAAKSANPEADFYFLQRLSEFVNDPKGNVILITTLHQDFSAYAFHLSESQRNEWIKVKGRFKEIAFNVPAEQLLLVAAERLFVQDRKWVQPGLQDVFQLVKRAKAFPLNDYLTEEMASKLFPLDILSGSVLTLALQRYGQNERSLFTFLDSDDHKGIQQFEQDEHARYFNLVHVFDYLRYHYYVVITAPNHPNFRNWQLMLDSLEKAEGLFEGEELQQALGIIKSVGLLTLFARKSMLIDEQFILDYLQFTMDYDATVVLRRLQGFGIIRFRKHDQRFVLFEGTDVDIDEAIELARTEISKVTSISQRLNKLFSFPAILAKQHYLETGTPRYYEFVLSDEPISMVPKGEVDGYINLVFSSTCTEDTIRLISADQDEAVIYVYYKHTAEIAELLAYTEQVEIARKKHEGDRVAVRELNGILRYQADLLKKTVMESLKRLDHSQISLYYNGEDLHHKVGNWGQLNSYLSKVAASVYEHAPRYANEMVNKSKLSAAISTARRTLLANLIEREPEEALGYAAQLFPPDKTIYLSLLKEQGFHKQAGESWQLMEPTADSFQPVWKEFLQFLEASKQTKRPLQEFVDIVSKRPYKIKKGLLDFLLPLFLLVRRESFALYHEGNKFIPNISVDTLDLLIRKPQDYSVKAFHVEGIRLDVFNNYRELLSQATADELSNKSFINTIVPFLTFYKDLSAYAKQTKGITKEAQRLRDAISKATDPEKSFFEDFPQALGYSISELNEAPAKLESYFDELRRSIKEIQTAYEALLERFEDYMRREILGISDAVSFEEWRAALQTRFAKARRDLLPPQLKTFLMRINSPLDDKQAWLNSVSQAVIGKSLDNVQDFEEDILHRKFKDFVEDLDNFTDILAATDATDIDHTFKVQVTNVQSGSNSRIVKVNQEKLKEAAKKQEKLMKALTDDKNLNIFILTRLLDEQLKND
ncbi:hypothetical protein [Sphingobacterium bambusae]|uniref:ATP-binding protein n=1 Tax=Sphingobacterium bambusae TaxID=662858 RepID=A0ABW6BMT9_9SPHI|nr:hypothetical protein [Sphingobacterium bambusae]WPL47905.1 hypothetical protein SCB77_18305 [Sphingobacterium bambusae]